MSFKSLFGSVIDFDAPNTLHLYTDGSCIRNGQPDSGCGWAFVFMIKDTDTTHSESCGCIGSTNNQMEITAVLNGLQYAAKHSTTVPITVYSDSQYVIETLKGNFKINKNANLWTQLFREVRKFTNIQFKWVKGHSTNEYNNECDRLANAEAQKYEKRSQEMKQPVS